MLQFATGKRDTDRSACGRFCFNFGGGQDRGIARSTLYRLVKAGKLQIYKSAIRRDVVLVKRSDLAALMTPVPIEGEEENGRLE